MPEKRAILVIEDDHAISNFICRALSASDYKPLAAASTSAAARRTNPCSCFTNHSSS